MGRKLGVAGKRKRKTKTIKTSLEIFPTGEPHWLTVFKVLLWKTIEVESGKDHTGLGQGKAELKPQLLASPSKIWPLFNYFNPGFVRAARLRLFIGVLSFQSACRGSRLSFIRG